MADTVENRTIRLLHEMRQHMDKRFDELARRVEATNTTRTLMDPDCPPVMIAQTRSKS